jgi:hypothetical protein
MAMSRTHILLLYAMVLRAVEDERVASSPASCYIRAKPIDTHGAVEKAVVTKSYYVAKTLWHGINPYKRSS